MNEEWKQILADYNKQSTLFGGRRGGPAVGFVMKKLGIITCGRLIIKHVLPSLKIIWSMREFCL